MFAWFRQILGFGEGRIIGFYFDAAPLVAGIATLLLAAVAGAYLAHRLDRHQGQAGAAFRNKLHASLRTIALVVIVLVLLRPTMVTELPMVSPQRAVVLLDASRSMRIVDEGRAGEDGGVLENPAGAVPATGAQGGLSRWQQARQSLDDALEDLAEDWRLECFTFDQSLRPLLPASQSGTERPSTGETEPLDEIRQRLAEFEPVGNRTALGAALNETLRGQPTPSTIVIFSDGVNNWGPGINDAARMARQMGVRLLVVAVGGEGKPDLSIARFDMPDAVPAGEANEVKVHLQQTGFTDQTVEVVLQQQDAELDRQRVRLTRRLVDVALQFTAHVPGSYEYSVHVQPLAGESSRENNTRIHKARVIDHKPQVLLVEQRPRWEWRFALAELRRDRRVGGGVKAYLWEQAPVPDDAPGGSGSLFVRDYPANLEALARYDVLVLGDVPPERLSSLQIDAIQRFVRDRGGGLIVLAGPDHAPADYFGTPLGDMLPVIATGAGPAGPFAIQPTPTPLGRTLFLDQAETAETLPADSLQHAVLYRCFPGTPHPMSETLAVRTVAGGPPLPVVLFRRYGRGRVLYIGTDDLWRLRGPVSGRWHNRFWIQAVVQTGMQKILGGDAHLELKSHKRSYYPGEPIEIQGTAYARDFSPSEVKQLQVQIRSAAGGTRVSTVKLQASEEKPGHFTGRIPAPSREGSYLLTATDSVTKREVERCVQVAATGPELQVTRADREQLQQLAASSGGLFCTPGELPQRVRELRSLRAKTLVTSQTPLWTSPLLLLLFIGALALEWWRRADWL